MLSSANSYTMPSANVTDSAQLRSASKTNQKTELPAPRVPPPESSLVADHFYWTYSDEPHRSRRQAIIKAHPEVPSARKLVHQKPWTNQFLGNQALRTGTSHEICRPRCCIPANHLCIPPPQHLDTLMALSRHRIRDGSHCQPEPVLGYP